jgi:flagellar hook-length control protein FliK
MTVSQEWIAEKLAMRSALNVSQQPRQFDRAKANIKLSPERLGFLKVAWQAEG